MKCINTCKDIYCLNARTCLKAELGSWIDRQPKEVVRYLAKKKLNPKKPKLVTPVERLYLAGHKLECICCGVKYPLTFDHIIPKSKGGTYGIKNGQILCIECNSLKSDKVISIEELKIMVNEHRNKTLPKL